MNEYVKWLENKIEQTLEDGNLGRKHWAFCQCLRKLRELGLIDVIETEDVQEDFENKLASGYWGDPIDPHTTNEYNPYNENS